MPINVTSIRYFVRTDYVRYTSRMEIRNFEALARSEARRKVLSILQAGYAAIDIREVLQKTIRLEGDRLFVQHHIFGLNQFEHIYVIGIGKAALAAAEVLESMLGEKITAGVILDIRPGNLKRIRTLVGTHPVPTKENTDAAKQIMDLAAGATEKDLVLTIISGGGSALLCYPFDFECTQSQKLYEASVHIGMTIEQMNTIRKHISEVKGGHLARILHPATVIGLIFSDIPGDDWELVASGPTYKDTSTVEDARRLAQDLHIGEFDFRGTPKEDIYFQRVTNIGVLCNRFALEAMAKKAKQLGYYPIIYSTQIQADAYKTGKLFTELSKPKHVILAGGEPSVIVTTDGKGGRCQSVGLGAFSHIRDGQTFAAVASDGIDNTDAAGVILDSMSVQKARELGLHHEEAISTNTAYTFFEKLGDLIFTGPTGTNVSDLLLIVEE